MARNRMIKVDFWADEKVGKMSITARLMFIGIWSFCDDSGVCRASAAFLRSHIFQHDDLSLSEVSLCIAEMVKQKLVTLTEYSGESFLRVNNFLRHQTINRPSAFRFISETDDKVLELFDSVSTHCQLSEHSVPKVKEKVKVKVKVNDQTAAAEAWVSVFNDALGSKFKPTNEVCRQVAKLVSDGHTVEDAFLVVSHFKRAWLSDEKMRRYLRPVTLFNVKFADRLDEARNADNLERQSKYEKIAKELDFE
jgi:uncharacterized phage protein (TIGR02220 family)